MIAANIALNGVRTGLARFDASAARVANSASSGSTDLVDEAVEQISGKQDVTANLAVLRTAFDMQNTFERFASPIGLLLPRLLQILSGADQMA